MPTLKKEPVPIYNFIDIDVAKENIGAVIGQYTSLIDDEEEKKTPNKKLLEKYEKQITELATLVRNFHKTPQDEIFGVRKKFGKLYRENQEKMKQGLYLAI